QGRIHLLLHTVERKPNQLLSQATITRYRQYTAGLLSVQNEGQLPDPASVPAGTLAVPSAAGRGIYVRGNTAMRWENPMVGEWHNLPYRSRARAYSPVGSFQARLIPGAFNYKADWPFTPHLVATLPELVICPHVCAHLGHIFFMR